MFALSMSSTLRDAALKMIKCVTVGSATTVNSKYVHHQLKLLSNNNNQQQSQNEHELLNMNHRANSLFCKQPATGRTMLSVQDGAEPQQHQQQANGITTSRSAIVFTTAADVQIVVNDGEDDECYEDSVHL